MNPQNWLRELRQGSIDPQEYYARGWIDEAVLSQADDLKDQLNFRIPYVYHKALDQSIADSAIKAQFVPSLAELEVSAGELDDPIGDDIHAPVPGITHRYPDRILLKPTLQCGIYCRFCFRRHKVSKPGRELSPSALQTAFAYIQHNPGIREVILTGGDPLTLSDKKLEVIVRAIESIDHVRSLRIHTKIPTALPSRITRELVGLLNHSAKPITLVCHINHLSEITQSAETAIQRLADSKVMLLQQGVLLKGVNDQPLVLKELFWGMIERRVIPYYLHYPDLARGTQHFRLPLEQAIELMKSLKGLVPGFALPRFMLDIPGGFGKIDALSNDLRRQERSDGAGNSISEWLARSPLDGSWHKILYH